MIKEEKEIKEVLKSLLKKKGMTYAALADELGVSLPTVRRIMTSESLSLERLVKICEAVGSSLSEIVEMTTRPDPELQFLTEDQEEFFCRYPDYYTYLRCLGRGMTVAEIAEVYGIGDKDSDRYVTELELLKLLRRRGREIQLLIKWPANFRFPGPLQRKFFEKISRHMLEQLTTRVLKDKGYATDFYYYVSPLVMLEGTYKKFVQEICELQLKYKHISDAERRRFHWSKLVRSTSLCAIDRVDVLEEILGPVKAK